MSDETEKLRIERNMALIALAESRARFGDLEHRIREKQAEAWDEGLLAGWHTKYEKRFPDNPYRNGATNG